MKIAPQLRAFLDCYHYLVLPQIGRFDVVSTEVNSLTGEIAGQRVHFRYDTEQKVPAEFIDFISGNLKIDGQLAKSDLCSFCNTIKELLNQGFEAEIPGIGFLHPDAKHRILFSGKSIYRSSLKPAMKKTPSFLSASFWL